MNRGISTWLFTKIVMLVFLTMTFAIIISFTGLVQQRSLSESAQQIALETTDGVQSLLGVNAQQGFRFVILPDEIPEEAENSFKYTVDIYKPQGESNTLAVAVAQGDYIEEVPSGKYLAGNSFKLPSGYSLELVEVEVETEKEIVQNQLLITSDEYNFIIIEMNGKNFRVYGCKEYTAEDCL